MENTNLDPAPDQADGGKIQDDLTRRILIAYSDGRSLSEIAKLHGLQVETVAEVLSRAIRNLVPGAGGIREKIKERYKENILDPLRRRAGVIGGPPKLEAKTAEGKLEEALLEAGLLNEIPPPITDFAPYRERKPVKVKGKPVSETIVEERR